MSRTAKGHENLDWATAMLRDATTAQELREAQAIYFPLALGMDIEQTARAIGRSLSATAKLRNRRTREEAGEQPKRRSKSDLRNRASADLPRENALLEALLKDSASGGVVVIPALHAQYQRLLGKEVSLSTLYRALHRHGWRKLAPDTAHPKGDPQRREDFKKNSRSYWHKP